MMLLGDSVMLRPGARVRPEGRPGLLPVGEAFLGRAVDGEGLPIDGGAPIHARGEWPAGGVRTGALDRSPVREAFDTGVRALNALTTFGVGQRIGIMAGSGVGKSVLLDMIAARRRGRDRRRRPDRRARARSLGLRRAAHGRGQARSHRRGRGARRPCAQPAPARRHAGDRAGRAFPRAGPARAADHGQPDPRRPRRARDRPAARRARRGARLSAVGARHDHQAGRARRQFGGERRLDHRHLHRARRWRQPGRSGGRYRALDPRRPHRAVARSGPARAVSGDRHRRLAQPGDERHRRARTARSTPANSAR